jgi:hypothetical protein
LSWFGSAPLGERQRVRRVIPRKPVRKQERKYAKKGELHYHRCPDPGDTFRWPCYVAECELPLEYPCIDHQGHFIVNTNLTTRREKS